MSSTVHQIWFDIAGLQKSAPFPRRRSSFVECDPQCQYKLWDIDAARGYMAEHCPHLLKVFEALPHEINRCDFFRYVLMFFEGGWYFDCDFICLRKLPSTYAKPIVGEEWPNSIEETLHNGALYSPRRHHLWMFVFEEIIARLNALPANEKNAIGASVLHLTGPAMLRHVAVHSPEITIMPFYVLCPLMSPSGPVADAEQGKQYYQDRSLLHFCHIEDLHELRVLFPKSLSVPLRNEMKSWQSLLR